MIVIAIFISISCIPFCFDVDSYSPEDLLKYNEYVSVGKLIKADTLINLGTVELYGEDFCFYIVEYKFQSKEIFKKFDNDSIIYLWYPVHISLRNGFIYSPKINNNNNVLIYGNQVIKWDNILDITLPIYHDKSDTLKKVLNGHVVLDKWDTYKSDSIIANGIINSIKLKKYFESRIQSGNIISGTDHNLSTQISYDRGGLSYCVDDLVTKIKTSEGYLKELRSLTD